MHKENWDDLRYVLAVADFGSVSKAAQSLGVNHATVLRRISSFETRHGAAIFERTAHGYQVLSHKLNVIEAAREAENAISVVQNLVGGHAPEWHGTVRVTSTDTFCYHLLPEIAAEIQSQTKQLRMELLSTNAHVDLSRLQADITIRPAAQLDENLVGEKAALMFFAVYVARDVPPENAKNWIGLSGPLTRSSPAAWIQENVAAETTVAAADSFQTLSQLAIAGLGRTFLPRFVGDRCPQLRRCASPNMSVPIWVASHSDYAETPRLRALRERLCVALSDRSKLLRGD
ncbi:LysR family transcriptional regulator [Falsihalocynthiibacter sp. SS001]|uniref:LysR family transcriptional regulator n=1 Tax=Falsihalocynthiibacter sp. SS001 TaxID=3349698 RepID=UPI0036D276D1